MDVGHVVTAPWHAARLVVRAADDLHTLAEHARRDPDPVAQVRDRIDRLLAEISALTGLIPPLAAVVGELRDTARAVDRTGVSIVAGGRDLEEVAQRIDRQSTELLQGGRELTTVSRSLDGRSAELIDGGQDLTAVAQELAGSLRIFRAVLPRVIEGLDDVQELEQAVEDMTETVEPLAGAAEGVGRITRKLSRRRTATD